MFCSLSGTADVFRETEETLIPCTFSESTMFSVVIYPALIEVIRTKERKYYDTLLEKGKWKEGMLY